LERAGFVGIEFSIGGGKPLALKLSKAARRSDSSSSSSSPLTLQFDIVYRYCFDIEQLR